MTDGITLRILGDFGPFSRMGKSIGYQLEIGESSYLVDCGSPLFQQIGGHGLQKTSGLLITHCHDDHKRWFSDVALFHHYAPDIYRRLFLMTSEDVHRDLKEASMPALSKSLSRDSERVIDIAYEEYVDYRMIGPAARYRIVRIAEGEGRTLFAVTDAGGSVLGPERAKIFISPKTGRPRMLFRDPEYGEWVEPDSFYPFSSNVFYEEDKNLFKGPGGFTIEAVKSSVWHGVAGIGLKVRTAEDTLLFSSDTAHDRRLWEGLYQQKMRQVRSMTEREFDKATVIVGDINDYIERLWSEERFQDAVAVFKDAVVLHDISSNGSIVHTDYEKLGHTLLRKDASLLTHSPDRFTSEWALCNAGKTFRVKEGRFFEVVGDKIWPLDADIYHKEGGKFYAGYRNDKSGRHTIYSKGGSLKFRSYNCGDAGTPLYKVDLYEDLSGRYFPVVEGKDAFYHERPDGQVELVEYAEDGSRGIVVEDCRGNIPR